MKLSHTFFYCGCSMLADPDLQTLVVCYRTSRCDESISENVTLATCCSLFDLFYEVPGTELGCFSCENISE